MAVEEVFEITGRGLVATGRIDRGSVQVDDAVELVGMFDGSTLSSIACVASFKQILARGVAGDSVGLLLRGVDRASIEPGVVIATPRSIVAVRSFDAELEFTLDGTASELAALEAKGVLRFLLRTAAVSGALILTNGCKGWAGGERVPASIVLARPVAVEAGQRFTLLADSRALATGRARKRNDGV
jgi:elongation factor Tu